MYKTIDREIFTLTAIGALLGLLTTCPLFNTELKLICFGCMWVIVGFAIRVPIRLYYNKVYQERLIEEPFSYKRIIR